MEDWGLPMIPTDPDESSAADLSLFIVTGRTHQSPQIRVYSPEKLDPFVSHKLHFH